MIRVRILNERGIKEFEKFINQVKENKNISKPDLNTDEFSSEFIPPIEIDEDKTFNTRMEMAKYLFNLFEKNEITRDKIIGEENKGLWTWLAYMWFNQITDNRNKIKRIERYIAFYPASPRERFQRRNIHLIYGTYYLFSLLREEYSKIFLSSKPYINWDTIDRLGCTEYIIRYPNIIKAAEILYWDENRQQLKKGSGNKKNPGNIRRFVTFINQFELTYNIYTMSPEEIISILPEEFNEWKQNYKEDK